MEKPNPKYSQYNVLFNFSQLQLCRLVSEAQLNASVLFFKDQSTGSGPCCTGCAVSCELWQVVLVLVAGDDGGTSGNTCGLSPLGPIVGQISVCHNTD